MQDLMFSVWVGGVEINAHYLPKDQAVLLANEYRADGYEDVAVAAACPNGDGDVFDCTPFCALCEGEGAIYA
jgi:hypothetical protein